MYVMFGYNNVDYYIGRIETNDTEFGYIIILVATAGTRKILQRNATQCTYATLNAV